MMRSGRLLVEESPENLLNSYRLPSLEAVFLKICIRDGVKKRVEQRIGVAADTSTATGPVATCQTAARPQQPSVDHVNMAFDDSISQISVSEVEHPQFPASPTNSSGVRKSTHITFKCPFYNAHISFAPNDIGTTSQLRIDQQHEQHDQP